MTVDVEVGGRAFRVSLTRVGTADAPDVVRIVLQPLDDPDAADTRTMHVEPRAHGLTLIDTADDRVIDAAVLARPHGHWLVQLPGVDGLELTRRLKADPATRPIVIIALTAYAMKGDHEKALAAGCDDYVTKPIDTRTLPVTVAKHLAARGVTP